MNTTDKLKFMCFIYTDHYLGNKVRQTMEKKST